MKGQRVAAFGCPRPRRSLTGEGDLFAAEARLVADHSARAALTRQAAAHGDAQWFALDRKVKLSAAAGRASSGHEVGSVVSIWAECRLDFKTMHHGQRDRVRFALECIGSLKHRYAPIGRAACFDRTPPSEEINRKISDLRHSRSVGAVLNFGLQKGERPHEPPDSCG